MVHNGIIENHLELKADLKAKGHIFNSETDSEVFAHLIAAELKSACTLSLCRSAALSFCRYSTIGIGTSRIADATRIRLSAPISRTT